jgi:universal stress protein A
MSQIKRMLVPTDFSPASDVAFAYALDMAARQQCTVHVLHVIDDASLATAYPDGFYVELPELRAKLLDEASRRLEAMTHACVARNVTASSEVVVGRPTRAIVEVATAKGTDLIVMGTHGRSGFAHLVLGSVAERIVRTAPCAVLTVRDTARIADAIAEATADERLAPQPA